MLYTRFYKDCNQRSWTSQRFIFAGKARNHPSIRILVTTLVTIERSAGILNVRQMSLKRKLFFLSGSTDS